MGTFILIAIALFVVVVIVKFIINKNKEKEFERTLPKEVLKTKKLYKGSLSRYVASKEEKTILRYFVSNRSYTINNFVPSDELLVKKCLLLFDRNRKIVSIIRDIRGHGPTIEIPFSDIISLQPVEISKNKKVTRGGISPISINGYRWASSTTKMLKKIERVFIELKYKVNNRERIYEINVFDGISYEDRDDYPKIINKVNDIINQFNRIVAE